MANSLGRTVELWLGSFLIAAILLMWCFKAPLLPVLIAGAVTLAWSLGRRLWPSKKGPSA